MSDAADQRQRPRETKWIDFGRPLDLNTITVIVAFIGGGMLFVSNVSARLDSFSQQFLTFQDRTDKSIGRLEDRIDNVIDGNPKGVRP